MKQLITTIFLLFAMVSKAQYVGINTTGASPNASAALDIKANDKGILIPRVALTSRLTYAPITAPLGVGTPSILVYNTVTSGNISNEVTPGYYFWTGTKWDRLLSGTTPWLTTGNSGLNTTDNFIGTTDNVDFVFRTNNLERARITSGGAFTIASAAAGASSLQVIDNGTTSVPFILTNNSCSYNFILTDNFSSANPTIGINAANYNSITVPEYLAINYVGTGQIVMGDHVGPWSDSMFDLGKNQARWRYIYLTNAAIVSSDSRLKSNVNVVPFGLETVLKLKPVIYEKYTDFEKKGEYVIETGFIAQELKVLIPNLVMGDSLDSGPMGVMYSQLVPVLTKALQDQQAIIKDLENRTKVLEGKLEK